MECGFTFRAGARLDREREHGGRFAPPDPDACVHGERRLHPSRVGFGKGAAAG